MNGMFDRFPMLLPVLKLSIQPHAFDFSIGQTLERIECEDETNVDNDNDKRKRHSVGRLRRSGHPAPEVWRLGYEVGSVTRRG